MRQVMYICDECGIKCISVPYSMKSVSGKGFLDLNIKLLNKVEDVGFHFCGLACLIQKINKLIEKE